MSQAAADPSEAVVIRRLSTLDRFLPLWIALAMAAGLVLGSLVPGLNGFLDKLKLGTVSLPIALGLLLMMYPVLTKVRYEDMGRMRGDGRMFGVSLFLSWVIGPALMFALAWLFLADEPAYRTGVIVVGLARCIAMVLVWNDLAGGDSDRAAILVVFNAIFQVVAYALLGWFYLNALPHLLGLNNQGFPVGIWEVARTTLIFLGIPLTAGYPTRRWGLRTHGRDWFESTVIPRIAPITLYGLLFTIVLLFAIQGDHITAEPLTVARIALPLLAYFAGMWALGFLIGRAMNLGYPKTATLASPSPPTTSSSPSPSPSASGAPAPARPWQASSARSSRCPSSSRSSTSPSGYADAGGPTSPPRGPSGARDS